MTIKMIQGKAVDMGVPEIDPVTGNVREMGFWATPAKPTAPRPTVAHLTREMGAWATLTHIRFAGFSRGSWWVGMVDGESVPLTGADMQRLRSAGHRLPAGGGVVDISVRLWADIRSGCDALCDVEAV